MVPVTRSISARSARPRRSASASTWSTWPGRPFFMVTALTHASRAPASRAAATACPSCSPVTSSRLVSSTMAGWPGPTRSRRMRRPTTTWVQFGRSSSSPVPPPKPDAVIVIVGQRPERRAERGDQRGAGRRGELHADVAAVARDPLEQAHRRRRRVRQPPVGAAHRARPRRHGGRRDARRPRAPRAPPPSRRCRRWRRARRPRGSAPGRRVGGAALPPRWPGRGRRPGRARVTRAGSAASSMSERDRRRGCGRPRRRR